MATEVRTEGLFNTACIDRQKKEADLDDLRQKQEADEKQVEWKKQHPDYKGNAPNFVTVRLPPLDPFISSLQIEGVGTVVATPDYGSHKSDARCVTSATQTLWNMAMGL